MPGVCTIIRFLFDNNNLFVVVKIGSSYRFCIVNYQNTKVTSLFCKDINFRIVWCVVMGNK